MQPNHASAGSSSSNAHSLSSSARPLSKLPRCFLQRLWHAVNDVACPLFLLQLLLHNPPNACSPHPSQVARSSPHLPKHFHQIHPVHNGLALHPRPIAGNAKQILGLGSSSIVPTLSSTLQRTHVLPCDPVKRHVHQIGCIWHSAVSHQPRKRVASSSLHCLCNHSAAGPPNLSQPRCRRLCQHLSSVTIHNHVHQVSHSPLQTLFVAPSIRSHNEHIFSGGSGGGGSTSDAGC